VIKYYVTNGKLSLKTFELTVAYARNQTHVRYI